jgi:hypothetical protein
MSTLITERDAFAQSVSFTSDSMAVMLGDDRFLSVPLAKYPRLLNSTPKERAKYEWIRDGHGVQWPDLDEDMSTEGLLAGRRSAESDASLARWLEQRQE